MPRMVDESGTEVLLLHKFLKRMGNEGVFKFAHVEAFGAVAPCTRDDGQGAVTTGMPRDTDLRVEDLLGGDLNGVAVLLLRLVLQGKRGLELFEPIKSVGIFSFKAPSRRSSAKSCAFLTILSSCISVPTIIRLG